MPIRSLDRPRYPRPRTTKHVAITSKIRSRENRRIHSTQVIKPDLPKLSPHPITKTSSLLTGIRTELNPRSLNHLQSSSSIHVSQCPSNTSFAFVPLAISKSLCRGDSAYRNVSSQIHRSWTNHEPRLTPRCLRYRYISCSLPRTKG